MANGFPNIYQGQVATPNFSQMNQRLSNQMNRLRQERESRRRWNESMQMKLWDRYYDVTDMQNFEAKMQRYSDAQQEIAVKHQQELQGLTKDLEGKLTPQIVAKANKITSQYETAINQLKAWQTDVVAYKEAMDKNPGEWKESAHQYMKYFAANKDVLQFDSSMIEREVYNPDKGLRDTDFADEFKENVKTRETVVEKGGKRYTSKYSYNPKFFDNKGNALVKEQIAYTAQHITSNKIDDDIRRTYNDNFNFVEDKESGRAIPQTNTDVYKKYYKIAEENITPNPDDIDIFNAWVWGEYGKKYFGKKIDAEIEPSRESGATGDVKNVPFVPFTGEDVGGSWNFGNVAVGFSGNNIDYYPVEGGKIDFSTTKKADFVNKKIVSVGTKQVGGENKVYMSLVDKDDTSLIAKLLAAETEKEREKIISEAGQKGARVMHIPYDKYGYILSNEGITLRGIEPFISNKKQKPSF
jgi:hypothetical protein